ncbi:MAG: hypothetical protein LBR70_07465 [Lactobacillaceae bacterium]|jgi:hypothetical protein|nr:hypothetical protein [Lactobacillaceae bacterium]
MKNVKFVGEGSRKDSPFIEFENFSNLELLLSDINPGAYFCVGLCADPSRQPPNVPMTNLFVADYRQFTPDEVFNAQVRGYSCLVADIPNRSIDANFTSSQSALIKEKRDKLIKSASDYEITPRSKTKQPYHFSRVQVYRLSRDGQSVTLEFKNFEWLKREKIRKVFADYIKEYSLELVPLEGVSAGEMGIKVCSLCLDESYGHFIKGKDYLVCAIRVRKPAEDTGGYSQRLLCVDIHSGIFQVVKYSGALIIEII